MCQESTTAIKVGGIETDDNDNRRHQKEIKIAILAHSKEQQDVRAAATNIHSMASLSNQSGWASLRIFLKRNLFKAVRLYFARNVSGRNNLAEVAFTAVEYFIETMQERTITSPQDMCVHGGKLQTLPELLKTEYK